VGVAAGVAGRVQHRQQQRYAAEAQQAYEQEPAQGPPPAAPEQAEADYASELVKLAQLRDQGVITSEDFEAKKAQLLGI
jgi:hypothetical protein